MLYSAKPHVKPQYNFLTFVCSSSSKAVEGGGGGERGGGVSLLWRPEVVKVYLPLVTRQDSDVIVQGALTTLHHLTRSPAWHVRHTPLRGNWFI